MDTDLFTSFEDNISTCCKNKLANSHITTTTNTNTNTSTISQFCLTGKFFNSYFKLNKVPKFPPPVTLPNTLLVRVKQTDK